MAPAAFDRLSTNKIPGEAAHCVTAFLSLDNSLDPWHLTCAHSFHFGPEFGFSERQPLRYLVLLTNLASAEVPFLYLSFAITHRLSVHRHPITTMTLLQSADYSHIHSTNHDSPHCKNESQQRRPTAGPSSKRPPRPAFKRGSTSSKYKRVSIDETPHVDLPVYDDEDMSSFLQYCTVCEKQIANPCSSILYCSERCRRKDRNKPLANTSMGIARSQDSRPTTPTQSHHFADDSTIRDIVPRKSPTLLASNRFSYTSLSSATSTSDIEPEFVDPFDPPSTTTTPARRRPSPPRHQDSEAAKYLRQFHSPTFMSESTSRPPRSRPMAQSRASTASIGTTAPSLTHSASNSASASPGTSPTTSTLTALTAFSLPYTYSRPLPPRTNPYSSSYGAKSISLVTPGFGPISSSPSSLEAVTEGLTSASLPGFKARASISTDVGAEHLPSELPGEELSYERKSVVGSLGESAGTLRSLFRFNEMQASPAPPSE